MRTTSRFAIFARGALLSLPLLAALASTARAENMPGEPQRVWGLGSALGGGVIGAGVVGLSGASTTSGFYPYPNFPTVEFKYFLQPHDFSIDITVPLTNIIIASAASHAFFFETDAMFNFNLGRGSIRGVLGPGLGIDVLAGNGGGAFGIRIPAEAGFEVLTAGRGFGFSVMARPWAEFVPAGGVAAIGGGALLMLGFMGYSTTQ